MAANIVTGLDIGSFAIKAAVIAHSGNNSRLISYGSIPSPQPGLSSENGLDLEAVSKSIKSLLTSIKVPNLNIVAALPESKIFTRIISDLPYLSDEELSSAIRYSAEEFVPLPSDQVNLYWQILDRSKQRNNTVVFVVASPKNTVNKYLKVLSNAGVKTIAMETELVAVARALIGNNQFAPTTLIVQLGFTSTDFAVVSKGIILMTRSVSAGGLALTRSISQYLNFEVSQAEEYKKIYGLLTDQLGGKIFQTIQPLMDMIVTETARIIQSFQIKNSQNPIKRIVLSGGGAKMPGVVIYFANKLGLEIQEADPWFAVQKDPAMVEKLIETAPLYTIAVGLALRQE